MSNEKAPNIQESHSSGVIAVISLQVTLDSTDILLWTKATNHGNISVQLTCSFNLFVCSAASHAAALLSWSCLLSNWGSPSGSVSPTLHRLLSLSHSAQSCLQLLLASRQQSIWGAFINMKADLPCNFPQHCSGSIAKRPGRYTRARDANPTGRYSFSRMAMQGRGRKSLLLPMSQWKTCCWDICAACEALAAFDSRNISSWFLVVFLQLKSLFLFPLVCKRMRQGTLNWPIWRMRSLLDRYISRNLFGIISRWEMFKRKKNFLSPMMRDAACCALERRSMLIGNACWRIERCRKEV